MGHLRVFFKIPPMEGLYKLVAVSTHRVKAFLKSWFKISKLMDSAWGKENQKSGRIVRFVSSKHFWSGQFVHNYSISRPNCLVCFIHLVLYKVNVCQPGRGIHCWGTPTSRGSLWPLQMLQGELCHQSPMPVSPPAFLDTHPLQEGKMAQINIFPVFSIHRESTQEAGLFYRE